MSEFKVGDRVRVVRDHTEGVGTITAIVNGSFPIRVALDNREQTTWRAYCTEDEVYKPAFRVGDRVRIDNAEGSYSQYDGRRGVVAGLGSYYGLEVVLDGDDPAAQGYAFKPTEVVWLSAGNEVPQPEPTPESCDCGLCQPETWVVDDLTADDYDPWDDAPDNVCDCADPDEVGPDISFESGVVDPVRSKALEMAIESGTGWGAEATVEQARIFESYLRGE